MCVITPADFEGFFEENGAMSPQLQPDIPHVMEIAKIWIGNPTAAECVSGARLCPQDQSQRVNDGEVLE